ncbi:IclR family transcriptional regulator [Diaminobutyricimonas sp. LJ205]|uniref:IclR family transcriptional regulator n=1 Tax=Diaminobutyricimonas sp. LJ205 TaxID=2683590 RepID=UPI0012F4DBF3|nr:IclR family transcriptional regulator [Diaminobutyricimonas sp. LJ205]
MAGRIQTPGESVLARAMRMLRAFDADHDRLTVAELAQRAGLPLSTAHRMATDLAEQGALSRTPDGRYTIGTALWELGELAPVSLRLRNLAMPHLMSLYDATGENVHLAVLDGYETLYLERITGPRAIRLLSRVGGRHPLHTTGVGKALLTTRDDTWFAGYAAVELERDTTFSITSHEHLLADIEAARERGYAVTRQEMTLGNVSIAAALPPIEGLPPAAVGVVTHLERVDEDTLAPQVVRTAQVIADTIRSAR